MSYKSHLSTQLLKSVLVIYFIITILVTLVHFGIEYSYTKSHIKDELTMVAKTFEPSLKTALWDLNSEQIESISNGIMNMPLVYGVVIIDPNKVLIVKQKKEELSDEDLSKKDLSHSFLIYKEFNENNILLAEVTLYSGDFAIYNRLKVGFTMILLNAFIKSAALILLFIFAFKKYLENPLRELTGNIDSLNWKSRENRKININFEEQNELYFLKQKFNELLLKISSEEDKRLSLVQDLNQQLEKEVRIRTQELEEANEKLQRLATTDVLTQLNNRVVLDKELQTQFNIFNRYKKVFTVIMMDLDFFKDVNDTFGHQVGDSVLKEVAHIIRENTRSIDVTGRWGGEEFLIICHETDLDGAYTLAETLRRKIQTHLFQHVEHKTACFGVAQIQEGVDIDMLIKNADDALYEAKKSGRNKSVKSPLSTLSF
ncbi:MAG: GGDEF domain-containing protein [Sulfurimonas sp.]|nr:GGDEF domain-containing protein [Sulfurimonas sp.]